MTQRLLLDSHTLLWLLDGSRTLRADTLQAITDVNNDVLVSVVTVWELAIKRESGRLQAPENLESAVYAQGYTSLPVTFRHAELAARLPLNHRDPFDRMLVAQAQTEGLVLVTDDSQISSYDVTTMLAR